MKAEDIIEGINKHIETKRREEGIKATGHIVLQKEVISNPTFKVYKNFKYTLWFTNKSKSTKIIVLNMTAKILNGLEESTIREMNILLSTELFNWIGSKEYKNVLLGDFKGELDYETT